MSSSQSPSKDSFDQQTDQTQKITSTKRKTQLRSSNLIKKVQNRCLQNNLVYCINMPLWFQDENVIKSKYFFGRYGKITSVIPTLIDKAKTKIPNSTYIQAYITYENQKDAALAIAATNQIKYKFRILRTTFGTNRMCLNYLKGQRCKIRNCFYLHEQKSCIKLQGPIITNFQRQKNIAYEIIKKNISYYLNKIDWQNKQGFRSRQMYKDKAQSFPSTKQIIQKLIQLQVIPRNTFLTARKQVISIKKRMSQTVKKIQYIRYKPKLIIQQKQEAGNIQKQQTKENPAFINNKQLQSGLNKQIINQNIQKDRLSYESSQFLMKNIIQSLQADNQQNKNNKKHVQIDYSNSQWNSLQSFTNFYSQKDFWQKQLLQTQQSEHQFNQNQNNQHYSSVNTSSTGSQSKNKINLQINKIDLQINTHNQQITKNNSQIIKKNSQINKDQSKQYDQGQDIELIIKVKKQIMKKRVKLSKLQFTLNTQFSSNSKQYEKVTQLLKNKLIL